MKQRTRKLIGSTVTVVYVMLYGPIAMALAESRIMEAPHAVQVIAYMILGLIWIVPLMPLIRWMQRPDEDNASR
jgi:hypothetical protein